ncbi:MAG: MAPEG family protein [Sphingomonadaceae bacterium]
MTPEILKPVVVLAAWSMLMWIMMYARRLPAMKRAGMLDTPMIGSVGADIRAKLSGRDQWPADNYNHLMEQPTVFYAVALTLALVGAGNSLNATLAWIYVAVRIVHSLVQVSVNHVPTRFALHALGTIPLIMLCAHAIAIVFAN